MHQLRKLRLQVLPFLKLQLTHGNLTGCFLSFWHDIISLWYFQICPLHFLFQTCNYPFLFETLVSLSGKWYFKRIIWVPKGSDVFSRSFQWTELENICLCIYKYIQMYVCKICHDNTDTFKSDLVLMRFYLTSSK